MIDNNVGVTAEYPSTIQCLNLAAFFEERVKIHFTITAEILARSLANFYCQ